MYHKKVLFLFCTLVLFGLFLAGQAPWSAQATDQQPAVPAANRTGAWVDTIQVSSFPAAGEAIAALEAGTLDFYTAPVYDAALYQQVKANPDLASFESTSRYNELTFNPVGPTFSGTGKLNPFSVPAIREAMNWVIDRNYISQNIMGGLAFPKYLVIDPGQPEFARYAETVEMLETAYTYNPGQAEAVISTEMRKLGATKVNGLWQYNGEPVTLIILIRVEDHRRQIGDYVADQLESIGFTVDRQYKTSSEASALWLWGDPADGLWHIYTAGWMGNLLSRDQGSDFGLFYMPFSTYGFSLLWQAYNPAPEFYAAAEALYNNDFYTFTERDQLFTAALTLSMEDSVHVWLINQKEFSPRQADTTAAYDLVNGLTKSDLWPYTIRRIGQEGGALDVGVSQLFNDPWNPIGGSNWPYDHFVQRATQDEGLLRDTNTGLYWPQRIESAEIYAETGTVITQTTDWLTLTFSDTIIVPEEAWVDWDATNQVWITNGEKFTETQTARIKSVVHYPADLFSTIAWHDGSPLSAADFVMAMIMPFDLADPSSAIYDESLVGAHENFMSSFKGYRITSTNPLVIEYYSNASALDAELMVKSLWPNYGYGEGAWHVMALGYLAEAAGDTAFTSAKADANQVEWLNFISEPSLTMLKGHLDQAQTDTFIPYANTLNTYISPAAAVARYANLQTWYTNQGHFWMGTGPFYLDAVSFNDGSATLQRYAPFPDLATKWESFSHDATPANLSINYTSGAPGSFFNITGANFPINSVAWVYINDQFVGTTFTGATGDFIFTLATTPQTSDGEYNVTVSVNPTADITFEIDAQAPLRPQEGNYKVIDLPQEYIYLPLVLR